MPGLKVEPGMTPGMTPGFVESGMTPGMALGMVPGMTPGFVRQGMPVYPHQGSFMGQQAKLREIQGGPMDNHDGYVVPLKPIREIGSISNTNS